MEFPCLNSLELNDNNITNIDCFEHITQFKLDRLYLDGNDGIDKDKNSKIIKKLQGKVKDFKI